MAAKRPGRKRKDRAKLPPTLVVDNPNYARAHSESQTNPSKIAVGYNPRESFAGYLYYREKITQAEFKAASRVRQAYETLGGSGASALDYTKEPVDGGSRSDPITERQRDAGSLLKDVYQYLGPQGHHLVLQLAGDGLWPRDIVREDDQTRRDYFSMRFRECLECLAVHWGYQNRRIIGTMRG